MTRPSRRAAGFTLIEIIVVIAISAILATIAIAYNTGVRDEVALSVETAKISQTILNAKSLALAAYTGTGGASAVVCGYGAFFDDASNTYSIFKYVPAAGVCPSLASTTADGVNSATEMQQYTPATWQIPLSDGVKLVSGGSGDDLSMVLFYPPQPVTFINTSAANPHVFGATEGTVHLATTDGANTSTVTVTLGGQVNYQQ
ncbi:MAG TPA: prepilin-type N-terminal cleavage/methylation domain-containing protein [Candidatus Paceibacterota bacterium]|jgi:prepilin-type N-terminal cleavage/methylation domain-containing protein|nr:prepilin-type N-terminal cleavage/methylation domain-containing protein [Candidatus Paceibacterota bacterium]